MKLRGFYSMPLLDVEGISLFYSVKGQGVPIVFIHPPVLNSANFESQSTILSKEFQVITFDIRGHGKSQYSSIPISYSLIARDIVCLLDVLGVEKAYICGYSTGGTIALEFLLSHADRALGGIVVSGMSEVRGLYLKKKIWLGLSLSNQGKVNLLTSAVSWGNTNRKDMFLKMYGNARTGDPRNFSQYYQHSLVYNCTHRLGEIHHPVCLIYGKRDKTFHFYAELLNEKLPHKELTFIAGAKHQIPTKSASIFNAIVKDFINRHENRSEI